VPFSLFYLGHYTEFFMIYVIKALISLFIPRILLIRAWLLLVSMDLNCSDGFFKVSSWPGFGVG